LPLRRLVADYCEKYIVIDREGVPAAFVVVSPASHPDSVAEAARATDAVCQALGPDLADAVLKPHHVGTMAGCSYSISAYCQPMSGNRWLSRWQRFRMAPAILAWLARVTRETARDVSDADSQLRRPLETLAKHASVTAGTRQHAGAALQALDRGEWRPRSVVAHNDLWFGNFVQRPAAKGATTPFYVIDWAGGSPAGMPFYDLVRISRSLSAGGARVRGEVRKHCDALRCTPADVPHYLSAAFGTLACHLGEWPEQQFARAADECLQYASGVI
jgi:hypothetical protein